MWLIAGGYWMWCYQCGAIRPVSAKGARWQKPSGVGGDNPAMSEHSIERGWGPRQASVDDAPSKA